jgi:hypothetical protein
MNSSAEVRESISTIVTASSSSSIILERWAMRDNQTGWQDIHERIINFRGKNRISIKPFLSMCGLPINRSYFQQLCCKTGSNLHPSGNVGSPGKQFLDAVKSFFQNSEPFIQTSGGNMDDLLCDLKLEHNDELQDLGISGIVLRDEIHSIVISCLAKAKEEEIHSYLKEKLGVEVDEITLEFRRIELLYSNPPYCALMEGACHDSISTITVLNLTGALVAVTCAHGVAHVDSDVFKITGAGQSDFGRVQLLDRNLDVAFVSPSPFQAISVNTVTYYDLLFESFWDFDENPGDIRQYLLQKTVMKVGVATGMTMGAIVEIDADKFLVDSNFATHGDSGSFVFTTDRVVVGLVTGKIVNGTRAEVLGIWKFYDALMSWY